MREVSRLLSVLSVALAMLSGNVFSAERNMSMNLISSAFSQHGDIPGRYSCEGADLSPPLAWSGVPGEAKSLVLIVDDPDAPDPAAPRMTWVHWVLYNIPPQVTGLGEGVSRAPGLPEGAREGLSDWKQEGYRGPCPPIGRHRYFHKLYALDTVLPVLRPATKSAVESAMRGHILAESELVGYYRKKK